MSNIFADFEDHIILYKNEIKRLTTELQTAQQINQQLQAENKKLKEDKN